MCPNGFEIEDITFKKGRKQSEILNEIISNGNIKNSSIELPCSLTPEQIIKYYAKKEVDTSNSKEKNLYHMTVILLKELLDLRRKLIHLRDEKNRKEDYDNGIENEEKDNIE